MRDLVRFVIWVIIMEEENGGLVVQSLIETVNEIASISDYRCAVKKQYCNLARRLKLLTPMLEEIRDSKDSIIPQQTLKALVSLKQALDSAKDLLKFGSEGSKIYMVCTPLLLFVFFLTIPSHFLYIYRVEKSIDTDLDFVYYRAE